MQRIRRLAASVPCWRIVFSTFRGCTSFYSQGHLRRINALATLAAGPLCVQQRPNSCSQQTVALCQSTKSLRDSPLRGGLTASTVPRREIVGGGRGALS